MVYFKLLLDEKRQKQDNIYPVVVRVTYNRNNTTLSTGIRVKKEFWDATAQQVRATTPNSQVVNKSLIAFYSQIQSISLQLVADKSFSFEDLKRRLSSSESLPQKVEKRYFNEYASRLIADMFEINKAGNAIIYQTATKRLMTFSVSVR